MRARTLLSGIFIFIGVLIFSISLFIKEKYSNSIDEMIYYLYNGLQGTSTAVYIMAINEISILFLCLLFTLLAPILLRKKYSVQIVYKRSQVKIISTAAIKKYNLLYSSVLLLISIVAGVSMTGLVDYIKRLNQYSDFIEKNIASAHEVNLTFPVQKRNLIILYVESLENSLIHSSHGGGTGYTVMPEIESLALNHLNFSNSDKIGGAVPISGTEWTVAAMVASTTGLPLKIPLDGNQYTSTNQFMAGAYALGDVLKENGYQLSLMVGSDVNFGGRGSYYRTHGDYNIIDVNTAIQEQRMKEQDRSNWGFDDSFLFKWAKEHIIDLADGGQPFSFSFLTVNTHFPDGHLEKHAERIFESQYENVHAHTSKQVADFVGWLQEQDFYQNTTLVILGDHLSMQDPEFFRSRTYEGYNRTIFNTFINSATTPINAKNRTFTTLDMYPTILASMGVGIDGERLGLGTNLFSNKSTLVEEYGANIVQRELVKNSSYYNRRILRDDYLELLKRSE
jgi:phosphoglycerol transferase